MQLSAVLTRAEEGGYITHNPEIMMTTDGETIEEALANQKEAVAAWTVAERGTVRPVWALRIDR